LAARVIDETAVNQMTGPEFHLLSESAGVNSLMTSDAAHVVVGWSETIRDGLFLFKDELVIRKPAITPRGGGNRIGDALINRSSEGAKIVKEIISLSIHIGGEGFGSRLTLDGRRRVDGQCQGHGEKQKNHEPYYFFHFYLLKLGKRTFVRDTRVLSLPSGKLLSGPFPFF
jgi:hypothetical protein